MTDPAPYTEAPAAPVRKLSRVLGAIALILSVVIFAFGVIPPLFLNSTGVIYQVPCTILSSTVETKIEEEPWGNSFRRFAIYEPKVEFQYEFRGQQYTSDRVTAVPTESLRDERRAFGIAAVYKKGEEQTCYVNEKAPDEAFLVANYPRTPYLFAFVGVVLALAGLFGLFSKGSV